MIWSKIILYFSLLTLLSSGVSTRAAGLSLQNSPSGQYLRARDFLEAQYSELEDLRIHLKHHEKIKTGGWIGIVISGAAMAGGSLLKLGAAMKNTYIQRGNDAVLGTAAKMPFATRGTLLVLGGAAGVLSSSAVIYMQKHQIAELRMKIEQLQARLRATIAEIEEITD